MKVKPQMQIALIYWACGLFWIWLSDHSIEGYENHLEHFLQTSKGFLYVSITAFLLFLLLHRHYGNLQMRVNELTLRTEELRQTENRYRLVFQSGQLSKWIIDAHSKAILDVNHTACLRYGYSREEFLKMNLNDLADKDSNNELMRKFSNATQSLRPFKSIIRHRSKHGQLIYADLKAVDMDYDGAPAQVVDANDITERINYILALDQQNEKLREIAWVQSHIVRAPLARILSIAHLLQEWRLDEAEQQSLLVQIEKSAHELDEIIGNVINNTEAIEIAEREEMEPIKA